MSSIFAGTCFSFLHHLQVPVRSSGRFKLVQKGPEIICAAPRRRCTQGGLPMKLLVIYPPFRVYGRGGKLTVHGARSRGRWPKEGKIAEEHFLHNLQVPGRSSGSCSQERHAAPGFWVDILPLYFPLRRSGRQVSTVGAASFLGYRATSLQHIAVSSLRIERTRRRTHEEV